MKTDMKSLAECPLTTNKPRRGGAALIVVLAMTGMLMFLGFFFFSYISAERNSAAWFALSANTQVSEDDYFDFAMQQILIGPPDDLKYSALYGRKWSLIPNMLGSFGPNLKPLDLHPFSGKGINVNYLISPQGLNDDNSPQNDQFGFDYNGDGGTDGNILNFSPGANPVTNGTNLIPFSPLGQEQHPNFIPDFEPDAGYTYPDINSLFLGYYCLIDTDNTAAGYNLKKVWIPSFHRPQYLPRNQSATGDPYTDIYSDPTFSNRVLRPHRSHTVQLLQRSGATVNRVGVSRYVTGPNYDAFTGGGAVGTPFPFPDFTNYNEYQAGIWTHGTAAGEDDKINYDVDADGLSANGAEAILLDLDHRVEILPDGTRRIPMYAITIMDADGLANLNATGNLYGENDTLAHTRVESTADIDASAFGDGRFVTHSNLGLSPGEINPGRMFYRPLPSVSPTRTMPDVSFNYDEMFRYNTSTTVTQVNQIDMANFEVARLLIGAADGNTSTDTDLVAGRWGEVARFPSQTELDNPALAAITGDNRITLDEVLNSISTYNPLPNPPTPRTTWSMPFFPAPGRAFSDDNNNYNNGVAKALIAGSQSQDPIFGPLDIGIPSGVHPLDPSGVAVNYFATGSRLSNTFNTFERTEAFVPSDTVYTEMGDANLTNDYGKLRSSKQPDVTNPSRWPAYSNRWELQVANDTATIDNMFDAAGVRPWHQATATIGTLQPVTSNSAANQFLADEPDEIRIDPAFRDLNNDSLFSVAEMMFLHTNDADWTNISAGLNSRLEQLATYNFQRADFNSTTPYDDSWWLRSQFTTDSFDRWEFAFSPAIGADPTNTSTARHWEFNPLATDPDRYVFPPEFAGAGRFTTNDPFRPELRQWLTIERNRTQIFSNFPLPQRRLNINRLLEKNASGKFVQRHLTPHPVFVTTDTDDNNILDLMYDATNSVVRLHDPIPNEVAFNNMQNDKFVQEWWAKYDRQRLARDIYVLLYTLGGPTYDGSGNAINYTTNTAAYSPEQLKLMAQFAVNYVDALDRDSVITEFVYDTNLADGWDITGEKDANGELVDTTGESERVFGVEAQQLTFSESLWAAFDNIQSTDSTETPWDDATTTPIQFLFLELRNASPFPAPYADGTWRIRRVIGIDDFEDPADSDTDVVATFKTAGAIPDIDGGANFWIGTHNINDDNLPAIITVDSNTDSSYDASEIFCPSRQLQTNTSLEPTCQLDLCHSSHDALFADDGNTTGYFLSDNPPATGVGSTFDIVLERRLNVYGAGQLENDAANPWVPVDYMTVENYGGLVDLFNGGATVDINQLNDVTSQERNQPLSRTSTQHTTETNGRSHTFGPATPLAYNDASYDPYIAPNKATGEVNSVKTFTHWQPHFDRDFTAVYELLSVPIVGPEELTDKLTQNDQMSGRFTAVSKFANPNPDVDAAAVNDNNLWYRILEFLEVPTSVQADIKDNLPIPRTPGKINLNTIRHPGVLAGLIDDDYHLSSFRTPAQVIADTDQTKSEYPYRQLEDPSEANRHWFEQFIYSRDRIDPIIGQPLPGIPGSRPFRPLSYLNVTDTTATPNLDARATVEHTLLRSLPYNEINGLPTPGFMTENSTNTGYYGSGWAPTDEDAGTDQTIQRRRLFEARTVNDVTVNAVDYHTRHRLLGKIANQTTVRSNVFYCWIYVQFHEAAEDEFGNVQIGGQLSGSPHDVKRAFFVIDRTKLEEAFDPRTGNFDWRKFILLRKEL